MANITWAKCKYVHQCICIYSIDLMNVSIVPSIDDCTLANGGCEHTCVPAIVTNSTTRTCQCDVGFELSADDEASCKGSLICLV